MRASAVTILWYFGIPVPLMITTPVGFFGSEERLWIPCSVYSCAPDRKSKCTTFSMGQLSRKHRAESCCLQTLAYLHKSNPTELLGGAGSLRGVRGQGLIMRARRHQVCYGGGHCQVQSILSICEGLALRPVPPPSANTKTHGYASTLLIDSHGGMC